MYSNLKYKVKPLKNLTVCTLKSYLVMLEIRIKNGRQRIHRGYSCEEWFYFIKQELKIREWHGIDYLL